MGLETNTKLTLRQLEIVRCLANGLTAQETAEVLFISKSTVDQTLLAARKKVGAKTTPHLVSIVIQQGDLVWTDDEDERQIRESELCGPAGG